MAELDPAAMNWREKIEALKRLPRPEPKSTSATPLCDSGGENDTPSTGLAPQLHNSKTNKDFVKLKIVTKREEATHPEYWDLYGYNDILNPTISAEERFEKYLTEMIRCKTKSPSKMERSSSFLPELPHSDLCSSRSKASSEVWDTQRLSDVGTRGAGYRILPRIIKQKSEDNVMSNQLRVSLSLDRDTAKIHPLPRGTYTAR